ncbi:MAG: hypothetical protein ABIZ72_08070 [Candidatus Limnocylindrales bacterium]
MTVDAAPRTRRRPSRASAVPKAGSTQLSYPDAEPTFTPAASYAIGEIDQTVFDCPSCSRPLALGARRCPGCRTRLVNGVTLGKASTFVAVGLAVGLLFGGGGGALFGLANAAGAGPVVVAAGPSRAPSTAAAGSSAPATPGATATGPAATPDAKIPAVMRSALVQVVATNGRLATAADDLRAALRTRVLDTSAVAQLLRGISADTVFGRQLAERLVAWPDSEIVGVQLRTFYGSLHDTAAKGLVASVRNVAAYRAAATEMVGLFDGMAAIDGAVRAAASAALIDLPAVPAP